MLAHVVEQILPEDQHPLSNLVKSQAISPHDPPCRLPASKPSLQLGERVEFVSPDEPRQEF